MKKLIMALVMILCVFACTALCEGDIMLPVGEKCDIIVHGDMEESVWYSEDDAIATVFGGSYYGTVTAVGEGSVNIVHRYVVIEPFSEYDAELGKTVNGSRSVTKKDYYLVQVVSAVYDDSADAVSGATQDEPDAATSATGYSDEPVPTAQPKANGEYEYKIYVTEEASREMKNYSTLKPGDKGKTVKKMKERLVELGYLYCEGKITNKYDDATEMAVYDFQITNNLTGSDGVAYAYTQYKLFDEFAIPYWGAYYYDLYIGDSGWDVERFQRRLCDIGYLDEEYVNGEFQVDTMDAVRLFQENNGFERTGEMTEWLQQVLFSSDINSYIED